MLSPSGRCGIINFLTVVQEWDAVEGEVQYRRIQSAFVSKQHHGTRPVVAVAEVQEPGARGHGGVHRLPALSNFDGRSSIAQHRAEREIVIEVVADIKSFKLIVGTIRFGQENDFGLDLIKRLSGLGPESLGNAASNITAESVDVEVAHPVHKAIHEIFPHVGLAEVRQRLRPEAPRDFSVLRLYKERWILLHEDIV